MVLSLLKLGFTTRDLREMPLTTCMHFVEAHNELMGEPTSSGPRKATKADIQRMLA